MSDLVLYADKRMISPWVLSVWVTLKEKALPFDLSIVDLGAGEARRGSYGGRALSQKVPGLEHKGALVTESLAIVEYLEETFPTPRVFPADPLARARDREVMSVIRTDFGELRKAMPIEALFTPPSQSPAHSPQVEAELDKALRLFASRPADAAARPTMADFELATMLRRPLMYGRELPAAARAYVEALWARPSMDSWFRSRPTP